MLEMRKTVDQEKQYPASKNLNRNKHRLQCIMNEMKFQFGTNIIMYMTSATSRAKGHSAQLVYAVLIDAFSKKVKPALGSWSGGRKSWEKETAERT